MRAAIYARVSTDRQEKEETVETQLMVVRDFCESNDINVLDEFVDEGWSGEKTFLEERPAGARLVEAIRAKQIDTVIVYKGERLARDWRLGAARELLSNLKARVIAVLDTQLNAEGSAGRTAWRTTQFTSGLYIDYVRENTMNGRYRVVRQGKWMSSVTPYGYIVIRCDCPERRKCTVPEHGTLAVHPDEAEVVRSIFQWALAGVGLHGIVRQLLDDSAPPRLEVSKHFGQPGCDGRGCKQVHLKQEAWHTSTVHRILTSRRYIGEATYGPEKLPMACPRSSTPTRSRQRTKRSGAASRFRSPTTATATYCAACSSAECAAAARSASQ